MEDEDEILLYVIDGIPVMTTIEGAITLEEKYGIKFHGANCTYCGQLWQCAGKEGVVDGL